MPYIKQDDREVLQKSGLLELKSYIGGMKDDNKKGLIAYAVMWLALKCFPISYYGISTATDAVRSALVEMEQYLGEYEEQKKQENGGVV